MSLVHNMLSDIEKKDKVQVPREPERASTPGLFVLDMPNEIVSDFYDLKEHIRIANRRDNISALAVADSSQDEGSSTIATYLAFLMAGGILKNLENSSNNEKSTENLCTISDSDKIFTAGFSQQTQRATTDDVFKDWRHSIDSRFDRHNRDSILLVDANMHTPHIHRFFGLDVKSGLADIVEHNRDWRQVSRPVRDANLSIITAGQTSLNPVELLGSDRFRDLVGEWKREFRYVIFDSPAVLNYIDAQSIASVVDGVVLVVKAGQTRWDSAQKAKQRLADAHANVLGVTLNRRKMDIPDGLYKRLV